MGTRLCAAEPDPTGTEFFERKVRPLFAEHCFKCHGEEKHKGGLRLDSLAAIRAGGDDGPLFVPRRPDESRLILAVSHQDADLKMPPKQRLSERQITDLTEWVKLGAPMPATDPPIPVTPANGQYDISAKDRAHWAFQPVRHPAVPRITGVGFPAANPIDAFIGERLQAKGLTPNPPATRRELLRRAFYDLTGLPPSPTEVTAFLADRSPHAWESLIDRLLDSPRYGEKWGRHWLDLVRYAESNSYERDAAKPHAWRYRDYVIRSFNTDKPYDRFLKEQLAGDEFPDPDDDALIATGYLRLGIWDDEPADKELARYNELDDLVATTGQAFLGLTVDCARCHNHKLDPIPQQDYYKLLAFFQNVTPYQNSGPTVEVPLPGNADEKALAATEIAGPPLETFVLLRGNPNVRGDRIEPGFPQVLAGSASMPPTIPRTHTCGRRTVLANWIAAPENPLTARVLVNRLWQHHFGHGIVRSPNNFGLQGDPPTHPELLDWLAGEFMAQGWRMKPIHRLIMTSQAYMRSSQGRATGLKLDPANESLWRFDMRRLGAEEIRDTILAVNGSINLKMSGPGVFVEIPKEVLAGQSVPGTGWGLSAPEEQARRSIYIHAKRSLLTPFLEGFDLAEPDRSTPVRFTTVQPTQALGMINGHFINQQARIFAVRLRREAGDDLRAQVRLGLYLVTAREPSDPEIRRGMELVESLEAGDPGARDRALQGFGLMALNLNEMIYLD